jgi:hypothetical protein
MRVPSAGAGGTGDGVPGRCKRASKYGRSGSGTG